MSDYLLPFEKLGIDDVARVGGKNASLGEMIRHLSGVGVRVPGGFATTALSFRDFLAQGGLAGRIRGRLAALDVNDVAALAAAGREIRRSIMDTPLPKRLCDEIQAAHARLLEAEGRDISVAVRSSATAEDLPQASFAGQQETRLNVRGEAAVLDAVRLVFASLYNDRAISYRAHHGFDHAAVALSAGIQRMVRADLACAGVMFTLDTESGFRDVVLINAAWGLGETVVQGAVNPDEFCLWKPAVVAGRHAILRRRLGAKHVKTIYGDGAEPVRTVEVPESDRARFALTDEEAHRLARMALAIERHYGRPMDIEWGKDGVDGGLYILQARPETVKSRADPTEIVRFQLKESGEALTEGRAIGARIGAGPARVIGGLADIGRVQPGDVLVTDMTDPDWEPVMKRAAAIVTNRGGRTCHAAIVARELGLPAIVGCGNATATVADGVPVTASCAEGETGRVYRGKLNYEVRRIGVGAMPPVPVKIMMNVGNPERAFDFQWLPNDGIGLARIEFLINREIGIHPKALIEYDRQPDDIREAIRPRIAGYPGPVPFYVAKLAEGIATLAAAFHPKPVIVRFSDFKSNEYANLLGGARYEPKEENPMIGLRGASRYVSATFRDCFELECRALKFVRDEMGLANVEVMIPFVRTVAEGRLVIEALARNGLARGTNGLKIIMMCEVPSNALLADEFLDLFDGFSIGSNDLTQLTLGLDRDSALVAHAFDERDAAVKALLSRAIEACHRRGKYIGICGQGPSDHPDLAQWLVAQGIGSVSLNPDTVVDTWLLLASQSSP